LISKGQKKELFAFPEAAALFAVSGLLQMRQERNADGYDATNQALGNNFNLEFLGLTKHANTNLVLFALPTAESVEYLRGHGTRDSGSQTNIKQHSRGQKPRITERGRRR
jgi:hypothetical protein